MIEDKMFLIRTYSFCIHSSLIHPSSVLLYIAYGPICAEWDLARVMYHVQSDRQAPSIPHDTFLTASKEARSHAQTRISPSSPLCRTIGPRGDYPDAILDCATSLSVSPCHVVGRRWAQLR